MTPWERAAQHRLDDIVVALREEAVIDMFERIVARVWQINVDRFEPSEVGDTNRSLGITAAENIRTLVIRDAWSVSNPAGLGAGVKVTAPNDSLLVEFAGVRLHVMKSAPSLALAEPQWDIDFNWAGESEVRNDAATANAACPGEYLAVPGGLFEDDLPGADSASRLREVMLVWAGGSNSPFTGGWIGLPVIGARPWLAVQNVWWHKPGTIVSDPRTSREMTADTFSTRNVPTPAISLKQRPSAAEQ
jgi:hypothetical protein